MTDVVDLTIIEPLILAHRRARNAEAQHKQEAEAYARRAREIEEQIAKVMGNARVGLVGDKEVIRRTPTTQFASALFRTQRPDLWEQVKTVEIKDVIDFDKLKQIDPEAYAEFQVTRWYNKAEV